MAQTLVLPHEVIGRLRRSVRKAWPDDLGGLSVLDWPLSWCFCGSIES